MTVTEQNIRSLEKKKFYNDGTVKIRETLRGNTFDAVKTEITTSAKKIEIPDNAKDGIILFHKTASEILYIGKDNTITEDGNNTFPLIENTYLEINIKKGSEIYGIGSATIQVYCSGVIKE